MRKSYVLGLGLALVGIISCSAYAKEWDEDIYGTWTHEGFTIDTDTWKDIPCTQVYVLNEDGTYSYQVIASGDNGGEADGTFTFNGSSVELNQINGDYVVKRLSCGFDEAEQCVLIVGDDNYYYHTEGAAENKSNDISDRIPSTSDAPAGGEFTLHGGVAFDMTADEMIEIEKANGLTPVKVTDGSLTFATEWGAGHSYDLSEYSSVYEVAGSFVADAFPTLYYFFDKDDKLCQMIYCGTSCYKSAQNITNINAALADIYVDKYGDYDTSAIDFENVSDMQNLPELKIDDDGFIIYTLSLTDSSYQWLYPYDNEHFADIEIQGLKWVMKGSGQSKEYPAYSTVVGYTRVSYDDVNDSVQQQKDKTAQVYDDI